MAAVAGPPGEGSAVATAVDPGDTAGPQLENTSATTTHMASDKSLSVFIYISSLNGIAINTVIPNLCTVIHAKAGIHLQILDTELLRTLQQLPRDGLVA